MTDKVSKFILLKNRVNLTEEQQVKLTNILKHSKRLKLAYELKEESRDIFESAQTVEAGKEKLRHS
jgi:transposase